MDIDPIASFRLWEIDVDIQGVRYTIPPLPAADWLPALITGNTLDIIPGMVANGGDLEERILDGEIPLSDITDAAHDVIEQAAGMPFWPAVVISHLSTKLWHVIGPKLIRSGLRFDEVPLAAALVSAHASILSVVPKEHRHSYESALEGTGPVKSRRSLQRAVSNHAEGAGPPPSTSLPSGDAPPKTRTRPPSLPPRARSSAPNPPPALPSRSGRQAKKLTDVARPASDKTSH